MRGKEGEEAQYIRVKGLCCAVCKICGSLVKKLSEGACKGDDGGRVTNIPRAATKHLVSWLVQKR